MIESLLNQPLSALDKGHVMLIASMGDDASIVRAARTSYGPGTKSVSQDSALINYLMEHDHATPFEMVELTFHLKLPLFVMAQLIRHRTANVNAMSARYSEMPDEFYIPSEWRLQSSSNKQGSENVSDNSQAIALSFKRQCDEAYAYYRWMLEQGISREMARMILPQNLYTQIVWKTDLRNLFNFIRLRLDSHAQPEIQVYAAHMLTAAEAIAPVATNAFKTHVLHAQRFSQTELQLLKQMAQADASAAVKAIADAPLTARQRQALLKKLDLEDFPHGRLPQAAPGQKV